MTDAKTYVDSRWGARNRDERKRLMSAYEAGQKQEGKMTTERTPDYWDGWNDAVESIQNIALRAKVPSPEARVAEAVSPSEEVEGRRTEHQYWRDDPTGWERTTEGYTSYGTEVVWTHPKRGSQVVSLGIERAIAAHFAMEQYDLLKARAERAEERASTAERRLEGHENLAAAAIRERDEARGEVERLQAALTRIRDKSSVPCGICPVDAPCSNCIARRALMEARVSTPVREERGE